MDLTDRELEQQCREDPLDGILVHHRAVDGDGGSAVAAAERICQRRSGSALGRCRVQQNDKGLARSGQLGGNALLRRYVILPVDVADRAVGRDQYADRTVVGDDLLRAQLRRVAEGHLALAPRGTHHALAVFLDIAHRALDDIAHTVDHPHAQSGVVLERNRDGVLGHKLRLGSHDGAPRGALGQLVDGALAQVLVRDVRHHERIHESLDESGFTRADGSHHADIDIPARAALYILINAFWFHVFLPMYSEIIFRMFGFPLELIQLAQTNLAVTPSVSSASCRPRYCRPAGHSPQSRPVGGSRSAWRYPTRCRRCR